MTCQLYIIYHIPLRNADEDQISTPTPNPRILSEETRWTSQKFGPLINLRPEPPFTGVSGPSRPKIAKKSPKISQKVQKCLKMSNFQTFLGIFGLSGVFLGTFLSDPPKRPFLRFFWPILGPEGPGDSCKWRLGSQ